jgi:hypothetical protein
MTGTGKGIISVLFPSPGSPELLTVDTARRPRHAAAVPCGGLLPAMF